MVRKGKSRMIEHVLFSLMILLAILTITSIGPTTLLFGTLLFVIAWIFGKEVEADENE